MRNVMDDQELAVDVLRHANDLAAQRLGAVVLQNPRKLTFEVDDTTTITLDRTIDNLEILVRQGKRPYDRAVIIQGDNDQTRILAVGDGYDLGHDASVDLFELLSSDPMASAPNVLHAGQIALLETVTSSLRIEPARADSFHTMMAAANFLGTGLK